MDNVAHSLVGYSLGKLVSSRKKTSEEIQKGIIWAGLIASNLPDFDMPWTNDRLSYLLHHRGWTHTLLFLPLVALLSVLIAKLFSRTTYRDAFRYFSLTAILGVLFHIGTDFCNDYGVHPFAPFNNRWYYGDFLFIVEPAVWFSMMPLAIIQARYRWSKALISLIGVGMFYVVWFKPYTPLWIAVGLSAWLFFLFVTQWSIRQKPLQASGVALGSFASVLLVFFVFSKHVKSEVQTLVNGPGEIALTPAPSNPLCWKVLIARTEGESYTANLGVVSLAPNYFNPQSCYVRIAAARTAPLQPLSLTPADSRFYWLGRFSGSLAEMKELLQNHCDFSELLKFARIPFWVKRKHSTVVGDLRYDFSEDLGFAKFEIQPQYPCSERLAPWEEPFTKLTN